MAELCAILDYISGEMQCDVFQDASLNGLQIEGNQTVNHLAVCVDAAVSTVEKAADIGADALLVHHGIFWGKPFPISGAKRRLIETALRNNLSLIAMHLPLDAHPTLGNNAILAELLELDDRRSAIPYGGKALACIGENRRAHTREVLLQKLAELPGAVPQFTRLCFGPAVPQRVCVISGSAADALYEFEKEGFDTFISGEPKQFAYHFCKENRLNAFFPGHYATETVGVKALADNIAKSFSIPWTFIDEPTGI